MCSHRGGLCFTYPLSGVYLHSPTHKQTNKRTNKANKHIFTLACLTHIHIYTRSLPPPLTINPPVKKRLQQSSSVCEEWKSALRSVTLFYFSSLLLLRLVLLPREIAGAKPPRRRTKLPLTPRTSHSGPAPLTL